MIRSRPALALFLVLSITAACGDDKTGPTETAMVRIVNASSGTVGAVDVTAAGSSLATGLSFRGSTASCVSIPAGSQTLAFTSAGTSIASVTSSFSGGGKYTVVLTGTGTTRTAYVLNDQATTPASGNIGVRFLNATGAAGDVHVTNPGAGTLSSATIISGGSNLAVGGSTAFLTTVNTNNRFRLSTVNTPGTVNSDTGATGVVMPTSNLSTIIFTNTVAAGGATYLQANPCT